MQLAAQIQGLAALALGELADRDACPSGNNAADLVVCHAVVDQGVLSRMHSLFALCQFFSELGETAVLQFRSPVEITALLGDLDLAADRIDFFTKF